MGSVRAEFLKLKRSLSWVVVVLLPLLAVLTGAANTAVSGQPLEGDWHTLWMRVVVFYGLFPLAVGMAVLASLVWRVEHQGGNWNALMGRKVSSFHVVVGKTAVLAVLAAAMQAVLVAGVIVVGKLVFALPGTLPPRYLLASVVVVLACVPVAALQSGLSMLMRSFAAPVAVALLGATSGVLLLVTRLEPVAVTLPYGLLSRATQMGTGMFADTGSVTTGLVSVVVAVALGLTAVLTVGAAAVLDRRDIR
ncbi:ABC transporter permease [Nocardiopsis alborubida]|uniref:ABC transporter permease n=1 Tax=Nocardiopsis alborubida TaxID=146802 RepID=A0A7X6RND4_9ACTN|nr:ABC transporter permease [Nocardiopsis alborubida]NKY96383.1 ABC transporter permease [Nocardiopsis alborubida]